MIEKNKFKNLTHLKNTHQKYLHTPSQDILEIFQNIYSQNNYSITFDCLEFTSLCPVTNQPDFGHIKIIYIPNKKCIESKSLKLYLFAFRNKNLFHEEAINRILNDIVTKCQPHKCTVYGNFRPRGGISLQIEANYKN